MRRAYAYSMTQAQQASIRPGDTLIYNDGRPSHTDARAEVLEFLQGGIVVQFEDRADTTYINHKDRSWWDYLTVADHDGYCGCRACEAIALRRNDPAGLS
jgi:hypothetical protein